MTPHYYSPIRSIDELMAEDNWGVGVGCEECGSTEWNILRRFGETKTVCASCGAELIDAPQTKNR